MKIQPYKAARFYLMDINCLIYMGLIGILLLFFHRETPTWRSDVLIHAVFVIAGLKLLRATERNPQHKVLESARTFYPILFYLYGFFELNRTARMFYGTFWFSDHLAKADKMLFGVYPTVWAEQFYTPWLDELMAIGYCSYYAAPLVGIYLFVRRKKAEALASFSIVTFGYFTNYVLFYLLPSVNPRMLPWLAALHTRDYTGYVVGYLLRLMEGEDGVVTGGCFPSSHVTATLLWALAGWRYCRKLGVVFTFATVGVFLSTVYLRYHHGLDPIGGVVWGFVCYFVSLWILKRRGEDPVFYERARHRS